MPPKKCAIKGEPDFHNIKDDKLDSFLDLTQQMIFAYKLHDEEKTKVLEDIWKDLCRESSDRLVNSVCSDLNNHVCESVEAPAPLLKKAPKLRKSPAKVKI